MIKILDHTKPLAELVNDQSNGLGYIEQISASIDEGLNGIYEGEVQVLVTDKHFADLIVGGYLLIELDEVRGKQIFEIYHIGKNINGVVTLKVQHITYKLSKAAVRPFTATGAVAAKNGMLENLVGSYPFTMTTDIVNETSKFTLDRPRSFRECLGGYEGSLLDVFRGEYEWDNLTVKMLAKRGFDNGVRIAYGKNLTDFQQEENNQNTYTAVLGYAVVNETTYTGEVYYKILSALPKIKIIDFSSDYEGEDVPTTADLTAKARSYAESNDIEVPSVNLTIAFIPLWQTEEYKNIAPLERVNLGDTVHVYFDKLDVEASARVISTTWNVNLKKYDKVELGNAKANMNTVINQIQEAASQEISGSQGFLETQLNEMATLIINGLGLHRTLVQSGEDGGYRIYLHNKKTLAESDTQYIFTAEGFLVSTDYGQTWNAGFDSQGNAILNSLATITLRALEIQGSVIRGSTIIFGDVTDKYITAQPYSDGITFNGTGIIRMQPQEAFFINNLTSNLENNYNQITLNKNASNSSNLAGIYNYDDTQNYLLANELSFNAHYNNESDIYNRMLMINYATVSGTRYEANALKLYANDDKNELYLLNRKVGKDSQNANRLYFLTNNTKNEIDFENYNFSTNNIGSNLQMIATSSQNQMFLRNKLPETTNDANYISFTSQSDGNMNRLNIYNFSSINANYYNRISMQASKTSALITLECPDFVGNSSSTIKLKHDKKIEIGVYSNGSRNVYCDFTENTITLYCKGSSSIIPRIILNGNDGTVKIFGTGVYYQNTKKW